MFTLLQLLRQTPAADSAATREAAVPGCRRRPGGARGPTRRRPAAARVPGAAARPAAPRAQRPPGPGPPCAAPAPRPDRHGRRARVQRAPARGVRLCPLRRAGRLVCALVSGLDEQRTLAGTCWQRSECASQQRACLRPRAGGLLAHAAHSRRRWSAQPRPAAAQHPAQRAQPTLRAAGRARAWWQRCVAASQSPTSPAPPAA